ncbi:MAG: Txe/YoeB family addiction module toxin [Oscillibacter sp.]|nr:Txe/YoeB family addiction module toxin [Oscillibacter sp.]
MQIQRIQWDYDAWEEYCQWQTISKSVLKRINMLVKDIRRSPFDGIGKPEPLKGNLSGFWSRRIDSENRIVYAVEGSTVVIIACKGHYSN